MMVKLFTVPVTVNQINADLRQRAGNSQTIVDVRLAVASRVAKGAHALIHPRAGFGARGPVLTRLTGAFGNVRFAPRSGKA
jgi:hypothetical protein